MVNDPDHTTGKHSSGGGSGRRRKISKNRSNRKNFKIIYFFA